MSFFRQLPERYFRQHGQVFHAQRGTDGNRRADMVRASGQLPEHGPGFFFIFRLAKREAFQKNERIRADDGGIRMFPEHGFRLGGGIVQAKFLRGHGSLFQFFRVPDNNGKGMPVFSSNSRRRGGGEARMTGESWEKKAVMKNREPIFLKLPG